MSLFAAADGFVGLLPQAGDPRDAWQAWHRHLLYVNPAAVTGTNAVAEFAVYNTTRKLRLVGARYTPSSGAVTGAATNNFSLILGKRAAGALSTLKTLATYTADATPAKDIAQWASRNLFTADLNGSAADTDFIFADGDSLTLSVSKAGTGMTFPAGTVQFVFEPRD
jgi:hypothetical protein